MRTFTRRGFTLIEMAVVLVLLGILAALAVPTFATLITSSEQDGAEAAAQAVITEINGTALGEARLNTAAYINACTAADTPYAACSGTDEVTVDTYEGSATATYDPATGEVTVALPAGQPSVVVTFRGDGSADTFTAQ